MLKLIYLFSYNIKFTFDLWIFHLLDSHISLALYSNNLKK